MLKVTVAFVALVVAGTANAAKWRDLRVDASSETAFAESLAVLKDKLSPRRAYVFGKALQDIWVQSTQAAEAAQREYTASDYYAQLDGLRYEQVVALADPTGEITRVRYREARLSAHREARLSAQLGGRPLDPGMDGMNRRPPAWTNRGRPGGVNGEQRSRGGNYTHAFQ